MMEKVLCKGLSLWKRFFAKRITPLRKMLFVKEFPFGKGSLHRNFLMERALCKSEWSFLMEKGPCKGVSFWNRLFV
jgi:hypothetical protein